MATWRVVGGSGPGGGPGGILVRAGHPLNSAALPERLATDALIEELELQGERLHFRLLSGRGPGEGWVSTKLKGKDLVVREGPDAEMSDAEFLKSLGLSADELELSPGPEKAETGMLKSKATVKDAGNGAFDPVSHYVLEITRLRSSYRETIPLARAMRDERLEETAKTKKLCKSNQWECVFKPRIAIRAAMDPNALIKRSLMFGETVEVIGEPVNGWLKLDDGTFALVRHATLGQLLEPVGAAARAEQEARIRELAEKMKKQVQSCSISVAGIDFARDEDRAGACIVKAMRAAEAQLEQAVGKSAAQEVIAMHAVPPERQEDGSEMFTLDFFSIGRGRCQRCGTCACLKWVYNLKDLRSQKCIDCDCEAREHKFLNEGIGEQPGFYPGISDEDMEKLEELRLEFENRASWH